MNPLRKELKRIPSPIAEALASVPPAAWLQSTTPAAAAPEPAPEDPPASALISLLGQDDGPEDRASDPVFRSDTRQAQAALIKVIGARLKEARELNNLSLSEAARRLGYSNPSKLCKVEMASDTNSIPLWLIERAAEMYDVGLDFLFGRSEEWDTTEEMANRRAASQWVFSAMNAARARDMAILQQLHDRIRFLAKVIPAHEAACREVAEAVKSFSLLNPEFETDMRGSAKVCGAIDRLNLSATEAMTKYRKLRLDLGLPNT